MSLSTIRVFIRGRFADAYIYGGHLFVVLENGDLQSVKMGDVASLLQSRMPEHEVPLGLALLRNEWLTNPQSASIHLSDDTRAGFEAHWQICADASERHADSFSTERLALPWHSHFQLQGMPLHDLRFYGMRGYFGGGPGVFEAPVLSLQTTREAVPLLGRPHRIHDARCIAVSAKAGEVVLSADRDGLFHGSLWGLPRNQSLEVTQAEGCARSIRTAWRSYDILNYTTPSTFEYLENETEEWTGEHDRVPFAGPEESPERKRRISRFAANRTAMSDVWGVPDSAELTFVFNSASKVFTVYRDGSLRWQTVDLGGDEVRLKQAHGLPSLGASRVMSACMVARGLVLEYFSQVVLVHAGEVRVLEQAPAIAVRSFPTARRFRRIALIVREDGIALHAVPPERGELGRLRPWR